MIFAIFGMPLDTCGPAHCAAGSERSIIPFFSKRTSPKFCTHCLGNHGVTLPSPIVYPAREPQVGSFGQLDACTQKRKHSSEIYQAISSTLSLSKILLPTAFRRGARGSAISKRPSLRLGALRGCKAARLHLPTTAAI